MSSEDTQMLPFNQYQKSDESPFIVNADLESLIKKWKDIKIILKNHLKQN